MKKILVGSVALVLAYSAQLVSAGYISGSQHTGQTVGNQRFFNQQDLAAPKSQNQCSAYWGQTRYYLTGDLDVDGIPDMGYVRGLKDNFNYSPASSSRVALILPRFGQYNGSTVSYYLPAGGANSLNIYNAGSQSSLTNTTAWYRYSKVAPTNQPVRAITSEPLLIEAPQSRLSGDAQFQVVYDINYAAFSSWGNGTSDYFVGTVPSMTDGNPVPASAKRYMKDGLTNANGPAWSSDYLNQTTTIVARAINWGAEQAHGSECTNIKTSRCGDGIVDSGSFDNGSANEQCDLGSANGQSGSTCSSSCMPVIITQQPDVTIVKSVEGVTTGYQSGDIVTYKITYRNIGTGAATNVKIVDDLPAGVTFQTSTSTPNIGNPTQAGTVLTWPTIASLAPGAQGDISVTVKLGPVAACSVVTNRAGISASNELPQYSGNNNTPPVNITTRCLEPDVLTTKTNSAVSGYYLPGMTVEYVLSYKNQGLAAASGVVLTDTLPSQVTYVSSVSTPNLGAPTQAGQTLTWNVGTLAPNATGQVVVRVTINANTPICTALNVTNNLTISATNETGALVNNNPSTSFFTMQCIDLWSKKVVNKPVVVSGDTVTYTISYGNSGSIALTGVVFDTLPTGMQFLPPSTSTPNTLPQPTIAGTNPQTLTWPVGLLAPGFQGTITVQAKIIQFASGQTYTNKVCIEGDGLNPNGSGYLNNNNCGEAISVGTGGDPLPPKFDLSIDKTPKMRTVSTGDIFDYTLTVSNTGNVGVTGFTVKDYLPSGLDYVSSSNGGVYTLATRTVVWTGLNIAPIGSFALTVKVKYVGPGAQTNWTEICDYNGVGGGVNPKDVDSDPCNGTGNNEDDVSSGSVIPGTNYYDLSIDKLINGVKSVTVGVPSTVTVTLNVSNSGTVGVSGFSVVDYMPTGLNYVLGSSNMPNTSYDATTRKITITGLNIGPIATFPITFQAIYNDTVTRTNYTEICTYNSTGSASFPQDRDSYECNRGPNTPIEDDESSAQIGPGGGGGGTQTIDLSLDKLVNGVKDYTANYGEVVTYTLKVKNNGNNDFSNVSVYDYIPQGVEYVAGSALPNGGTITVGYDASARKLIWSGLNMLLGTTIDLSFKATYNDTTDRTNYAEVCNYPGMSGSTNPKDSNSNPCNRGANTPIEDDESSAIIRPRTGGGGGGGRNYCGDGLIARPNSNGQYEECDLGTNTSQSDYNGKPGGKCSITCKDIIPVGGTCGDYIVQVGEVCDRGPNGGLITTGVYKGRTCTNACRILERPTLTAPKCDYIDPPSIQQGEYLPYRWDLENIGGVVSSCTAAGQIVRDTMKCEFKLEDANGNTLQVLPSEDCYQPLGASDVLLKSAYVQTMKSLGYSDPFMDKLKPYGFDAKQFVFNNLGEHKISVSVKSYSRCETDGKGSFTQINVQKDANLERVCEMNFAVTKPYMVSRGPLGNFASDPLTSFAAFPAGAKIFSTAVPQITTKFDVTPEVTTSVNKLVDTYAGLAVSAGTLPGTTKTIKKVPGKDVYLVDAAGSYITIGDNSENAIGSKPFTLIVTNGDLVVKGNLSNASRGMYIVKNGNIKFSMEDCNATQAVQGIFITLASVESLNAEGRSSIHNTDTSKARCNGGDLTIKGVIIGNGVKAMAESTLRRSNVNTWFTESSNSIQADRQEYLLNHGALVLKYNPDLFDHLPPGADVLSQVLSTYKK